MNRNDIQFLSLFILTAIFNLNLGTGLVAFAENTSSLSASCAQDLNQSQEREKIHNINESSHIVKDGLFAPSTSTKNFDFSDSKTLISNFFTKEKNQFLSTFFSEVQRLHLEKPYFPISKIPLS